MARRPLTLSESAENYLKAIYRLSIGGEFVKPRILIELLSYAPSTVTLTLQRLAKRGYIEYVKYKGVRLTEEGCRIAARILRAHRVFEVFLYSKLGMDYVKVHSEACRAEHALSEETVQRLEEFLGHPKRCPHGNPIPPHGAILEREIPLCMAKPGEYIVSRIAYETPTILLTTYRMGIIPGARMTLVSVDSRHRYVLLRTLKGEHTLISSIAKIVSVVPKTTSYKPHREKEI